MFFKLLQVLACYRRLHRARLKTFAGDTAALEAGRQRIRQEFVKNKHETDINKINELLSVGKDVEKMLRQAVVQGVYNVEKNSYELKVTKETLLQDNAPLPPKK